MKSARSSVVLFVATFVLTFTAVSQQTSPSPLVWPRPPEKARIQYLYSLSDKADLGIEKSFLRKIWDFIIGADEDKERIVQPAGVAADSQGRIYVTDPGASCIHVFDVEEKEYEQIRETESGVFSWPIGIAAADDGTLYVCDAVRKEVVVLSSEWTPIRTIRHQFERPTGIAIKNNKIYVVDTPLHKISVFDLQGNFLFEFGTRGSGTGEFNFPVHITAGKNLYVVDAMNHRVQVLDDSGHVQNMFGEVGNVVGTFANPKGIAVDTEEHLYVTDALFDAFQIFDTKGTILLAVGQSGSAAGEFQSPAGIFVDKQNRIYAVDTFNRRIQIFRYLP